MREADLLKQANVSDPRQTRLPANKQPEAARRLMKKQSRLRLFTLHGRCAQWRVTKKFLLIVGPGGAGCRLDFITMEGGNYQLNHRRDYSVVVNGEVHCRTFRLPTRGRE